MSVWSVSDVTQGLAGTLRKAAKATGAGFDYLIKTAMRESGLDPSAKAATSSASGMFQFVEQTWLETVKANGAKYGLGAEAAAIGRGADGRYRVADPKMRADILALRNDPEISSLMAGEFTGRNRAMMSAALKRPPSEGELYAAHFLGAQGAIDLIRLSSADPGAAAAAHFPDAAAANRSVFYSGGRPRAAADVLAKLVKGQEAVPVPQAQPLLAQGPAAFFAKAPAAEDGSALAFGADRPVFHSMFQTAQRPPVSAYVQGIWADLVPGKPLDLTSFLNKGGADGPPGGA